MLILETPVMHLDQIIGGAGCVLSADKRFRYKLWRWWDPTLPTCVFCLLNPSTADHQVDDPTVKRCVGFARRWGFGRVEVVNLFAWRATRPDDLPGVADPVGEINDSLILASAKDPTVSRIVAGWGVGVGTWGVNGRDGTVLKLLAEAGKPVQCLGRTKDGSPRHPLYLASATKLEAYP